MARPARPFHLAVLTAYLGVAGVFVALLLNGVIGSITVEMGLSAGNPQTCGTETPDSCTRQLISLRQALDAKLSEFQRAGGSGERLWDEWSVVWRRELARVEGQCCLGRKEVPEGFQRLVRADHDLRQLEALYTTHVVQYAREIGAKAEAVDRELGLPPSSMPSSTLGPSSSAPPPKNGPLDR
jgi:hypothetical protein